MQRKSRRRMGAWAPYKRGAERRAKSGSGNCERGGLLGGSLWRSGLRAAETYEVAGAVGGVAVAVFYPEIDGMTGVAATADDLAGSVGRNRVLLEFVLIDVLRRTDDSVVGI